MSIEKAYIALVKPPDNTSTTPSLSSLTSQKGSKGEVRFMFNPSSYSVTKTATWRRGQAVKAPSSAMPEFIGSEPAKMDLDILLDHSDRDTPTVTRDVDTLLSAVMPLRETLDKDRPSPPWAVFGWGSRIPMVAIITSVSATYTLFKPDGTPIRAMCKISLEEVPTSPPPRQNPTSGSESTLRQHTMTAGDTLPSIARDAYGRASAWRSVAEYNDIDDPWALRPGDTILLPALEEETA